MSSASRTRPSRRTPGASTGSWVPRADAMPSPAAESWNCFSRVPFLTPGEFGRGDDNSPWSPASSRSSVEAIHQGAELMTTANIDHALERNRAFAAAGGHEGAVVFPNLRLFV